MQRWDVCTTRWYFKLQSMEASENIVQILGWISTVIYPYSSHNQVTTRFHSIPTSPLQLQQPTAEPHSWSNQLLVAFHMPCHLLYQVLLQSSKLSFYWLLMTSGWHVIAAVVSWTFGEIYRVPESFGENSPFV